MSEVKSCCPPGSHPALKEDTSRKLDGVVSEVDGIPIYTVTPPEKVTKDNKMEGRCRQGLNLVVLRVFF